MEVVVGLQHQPLRHRIGVLHHVVTARIGGDQRGAPIHEGVLALAHGQRVVGEPLLARVHDAVPVLVVEDVAFEAGPPARQGQDPHVDHLANTHGDVDEVEDVVEPLVPPGERVVARRHVLDVEGAVGIAPSHPDDRVPVGEIGERHPGSGIGLSIFPPCSPPQIPPGNATPPFSRHVDLHLVDDALDGAAPSRQGVQGRSRDVAEDDRREGLAGDDELGVEAGGALHDPGVPVEVSFQRRGLDPAGAVRGRDREGVAVRSEVWDLELALDCGASGREASVLDHRQAGRVDGTPARSVDGQDRPHIDASTHHVALAQADPGAAQGRTVDVRRHLAQVVGDVPLEPRQAVLGGQVRRSVHGRDVLEDGGLDGGVRQRVGLHPDGDVRRPAAHREVLPVDLVPVGEHRDEVPAVRERQREVRLIPLRVDRGGARDSGDGRPQAGRRIPGVLRTAAAAGRRRPLARRAGVVDVHEVAELSDRRAVLGAHDAQVQRVGLRLGVRGHPDGKAPGDEQSHHAGGDPVDPVLHGSLAGARAPARKGAAGAVACARRRCYGVPVASGGAGSWRGSRALPLIGGAPRRGGLADLARSPGVNGKPAHFVCTGKYPVVEIPRRRVAVHASCDKTDHMERPGGSLVHSTCNGPFDGAATSAPCASATPPRG